MCIDDKNIGGEGYTILSNKDTGKIASLIMSTKSSVVSNVLSNIDMSLRLKVKTITKDLAESYDWVSRTMFSNATRVADKFHVIKLGLEALQSIRIRHRQEALLNDKKCSTNKELKNKLLNNGESVKELLARSRYLLFKFKTAWTDSQAERAKILFEMFPDLSTSYDLICSFRSIYNLSTRDTKFAKRCLDKWKIQVKAKASHIPEMVAFLRTVEHHEPDIVNYFSTRQTNAFAESLNNKIQSMVRTNYGIRNRDFFHFRIRTFLT